MTAKIIIIIVLFFLAYNGFDGLRGSKNLVDYSIDNIEQSGIGENRYININNGYTTSQFVYSYSKKTPNSISSVIFPLISKERLKKYINGEKNISIDVLIKRNSNKFKSNCIVDTSCVNDILNQQTNGYSVKGVTLIGLNDVDEETRNLLSSSGFNIANKVVFLEEDTEPQSNTKSILMLIGGIIGIIIVLSTFKKSTN